MNETMDKVILITGASSDLGTAYIREKGQEYARIIAHYHHDNDKFAALRADYGDRITPVQADFGR